jgi:hypothetical protein
MPTAYDPSLPVGLIFRRDWKLENSYTIQVDATIRKLAPRRIDVPDWQHFESGYGLMGAAFGSQCQHEGWSISEVRGEATGHPAWMACWRDDGRFGFYDHGTEEPKPVRPGAEKSAPALRSGDAVTVEVDVAAGPDGAAKVTATLELEGSSTSVVVENVDCRVCTDGYFGLVGRGLLDFEVTAVRLVPRENRQLNAPINELHVAYPLGETLRQQDDTWQCRFMTLFRSEGQEAAIRIADSPHPEEGWENVPIAGTGEIVNNDFRRHTAVIEATFPTDPSVTTLYYTIWKDDRDVTADPRIGTDSVGEGTGFIGEVPGSGSYVGRLPRLAAPYRLCGLSCHAITGGNPELRRAGTYDAWWLHDQPTPQAYQHLDDFDYQILVWEDDVWYLELIYPPASVDDAYKVITTTIGGPTTRWQMMHHWNVLNPGDHDHGMDDVKGPEQIIIRNEEDLGLDPEYMRRNFQIVSHLVRGETNPTARGNPKRWKRWRMPNGDFSLLILDGRLWRTSQDTNIWDDEGWGHEQSLYSRDNPTRALLGEEQFAWLQEMVRTDASPLMALTGINGLHTVWTDRDGEFKERHKTAADYAGWVSAGANRVLELLGSRQGLVTVYGDVHTGCIMENPEHRLVESCFGAIGRYGSRGLKPGFGRQMEDFDGRDVTIHALYHDEYRNPEQEPIEGPKYWNMLAMEFDPRGEEPTYTLKLHNLVDGPDDEPRGGGHLVRKVSETGRPPASRLPAFETLPEAVILLTTLEGRPIRGTRSLADGTVPIDGLIDVPPETRVLVSARTANASDATVVTTQPV